MDGLQDFERILEEAEIVSDERVPPPAPTTAPAPDLPQDPGLGGSGSVPPGGEGGEIDRSCAGLPMTDLGNAKRFMARFGEDFRFVREWGWLTWDGRRWNRAGAEDRMQTAVKQTIERISDEARALIGTKADKVVRTSRKEAVRLSDDLLDWAEKSQAAGHINCISGLVQSYLAYTTADFDTDPMLLNCLNGTLDVRRRDDEPYVQLRPHNRADLCTKLMPVDYDPQATCPQFDRFLDRVQKPDGDGGRPMQRFLDQWGGLSLTGDATEQKLSFLHGRGRNGKSVWMDTVAYVAGDYADTIPIETFLEQGKGRNAGAPSPDLAMLAGVRMLRTSEPEKNAKLGEALIKLATGGEPMKVRELNKGYFTLKVQFKLTIQGNYRPKIDGTDEGIWGRIMLVPWPEFIPKHERDKKLTEKLRGEAAGILNRLLNGLCDWLDNGLVIPRAIDEATDAYRADSDPLGRFLSVCTRSTIGKRCQSLALYQLFQAWAKSSGETEWSHKGFAAGMSDRGIASKKSSGMWFLDLEMIRDVNDFVDYAGNPIKAADDEVID